MNIYKIASINLQFRYHFDTFFKDNLEKYLTTDTYFDYSMEVHVVDPMHPRLETPTYAFKNRQVYEFNAITVIDVLDENGFVKHRVEHSNDYKNIDIYLSNRLQNLDEMEYIITGMLFLEIVTKEGFVALHGSAVIKDDQCIIFSAPSKTGKSTHARYWTNYFDDTSILNDDKPLLFIDNDRLMVASSPWSGKSAVNQNAIFPLKSIVFLSQGELNLVNEMTNKSKIEHLLKNTARPRNKESMAILLQNIGEIVEKTPIVLYEVSNHISSVQTIYNYLFGGQNEN